MREIKTLPQLTKAIEGRTVTTLFSVAGNVDSYQDRMWPGAFTKTFRERGNKVLHLWQHNFDMPPIGVVKGLRELTREELPPEVLSDYPEATGGAEAVTDFLDTARAEEVLKALQGGAPLEASFGYDALRYDFTEEADAQIRNLREVRLWEVSTVLWGANAASLGSKFYLPLDFLSDQLGVHLAARKDGRRNATGDQARINQIAELAAELGADNIKLLDAADKAALTEGKQTQRRAGATAPPLTLLSESLRLLELSI